MSEETKIRAPEDPEAQAVRAFMGVLSEALLQADSCDSLEAFVLGAVVRGSDGETYLVTTARFRGEPAAEDSRLVADVERKLTLSTLVASDVVRRIVERRN